MLDDGRTLKELIDYFFFENWLNCGRCLNLNDYLDTLGYTNLKMNACLGDINAFLSIIELVYNFWYIVQTHIDRIREEIEGPGTHYLLKSVMDDCLSEYNQKAFYFPEEEKCIVAEDSPQVTAAAEASEPELALEIVRYNHRQLAGDISKKKAVLRSLGDHLEGRKNEISSINASLYNCITGALNNLNIRHNNINPDNKTSYHKAVAEMPDEELEEHYDDLYQLILLAILEMDNSQRQRDMKALIQKINE